MWVVLGGTHVIALFWVRVGYKHSEKYFLLHAWYTDSELDINAVCVLFKHVYHPVLKKIVSLLRSALYLFFFFFNVKATKRETAAGPG